MVRATTIFLLALLAASDPQAHTSAASRDPDAGTAVITGRVVTATSAPLRRVQIRASAAGVPLARFATTNAEGRFQLANLPAGKWTLTASRSGYVTQRFGQRHALQVVDPIDLSDGERFTGANFVLPRGGVITGRIYDESGEAMEGVRVNALRQRMVDGRRQMSVTMLGDQSDDTGTYRIYGLPPGDYYVVASHLGESTDGLPNRPMYAPTFSPAARTAVKAANAEREVASLPITVGDEDLSLTVTTGKGAVINGSLMTDARTALPRATIRVVAQAILGPGRMSWDSAVSETGAFRIAGLAGLHALQVEGLPDGWIVKSFSLNGVDVTDTPIELKASEQIYDAHVVVTNRVAAVAGRVTLSGRPAQRAIVIVFPEDEMKWAFPTRSVRSIRGDDQGRFVLRGLLPGVRYLALAVDYLEESEGSDPEFLERMKNLATQFTPREGDNQDLALGLVARW